MYQGTLQEHLEASARIARVSRLAIRLSISGRHPKILDAVKKLRNSLLLDAAIDYLDHQLGVLPADDRH